MAFIWNQILEDKYSGVYILSKKSSPPKFETLFSHFFPFNPLFPRVGKKPGFFLKKTRPVVFFKKSRLLLKKAGLFWLFYILFHILTNQSFLGLFSIPLFFENFHDDWLLSIYPIHPYKCMLPTLFLSVFKGNFRVFFHSRTVLIGNTPQWGSRSRN